MKKIIPVLLLICALFSLALPALADDADSARAVIGADLTDEQIESVYDIFGISRGSIDELTVTNAEERQALTDFVDADIIGSNSISCVYIELLPAGEGLQIETENLTWCTEDMFVNALVTAGVDDARIIVTAPFAVSGTAALTGIYKAYEDITGREIDDLAKLVSTQELVVTGELADFVGSYDAVSIVNELKLILSETENMSDDELSAAIREIADEYGVKLRDSQIGQLITLCCSLEKMDGDALRGKVEQVQQTVRRMAEAKEKVSGISRAVKNVVEAVKEFVGKILSFFGID